MLKFGIELEYFVVDAKGITPAYKHTSNLDGNPVLGELRTGIFDNLIDAVFDLKRRMYLENESLKKKGVNIFSSDGVLGHTVKVDDEFLKALRADKHYTSQKETEWLVERSIYGKKTGKVLPKVVIKASLQINISDNDVITHYYTGENKESKSFKKSYSEVFDYISILSVLDKHFSEEIKKSDRVPGVYAIKDGELGKRIEYRSLPNDVSLDKLLTIKFN